MTTWRPEPTPPNLEQLRATVEQARKRLIEAEAELADRQAEVNAFAFEFEARVGYLLERMAALDDDLKRYHDLIETVRNRDVFGNAYLSVEKQYQQRYKPAPSAPTPPLSPLPPATEAEIKKLYRHLARQFHPDLAHTEQDRAYRTEKMTAVNNAYAARSLVELQHLAQEALLNQPHSPGQTETQLREALQAELQRCRQRLQTIEVELRELHHLPMVALSLEAKLARQRGQDFLSHMKRDLEAKIARKTVERDLLKAQVDQLGPDQGVIPI